MKTPSILCLMQIAATVNRIYWLVAIQFVVWKELIEMAKSIARSSSKKGKQ